MKEAACILRPAPEPEPSVSAGNRFVFVAHINGSRLGISVYTPEMVDLTFLQRTPHGWRGRAAGGRIPRRTATLPEWLREHLPGLLKQEHVMAARRKAKAENRKLEGRDARYTHKVGAVGPGDRIPGLPKITVCSASARALSEAAGEVYATE